jgi:hypothetical protein
MKVDVNQIEDMEDLEFMHDVRIKQRSRNKNKLINKDPMKKGKGKKPRTRRDFRK